MTPGTLRMRETCFYNRSLPISTAIIGCESVEQVGECAELSPFLYPVEPSSDGYSGSQGRSDCKAGALSPAHAIAKRWLTWRLINVQKPSLVGRVWTRALVRRSRQPRRVGMWTIA
jgi:hypothetical protein